MSNALTNGATITVVSSGSSYHTLTDWNLAISNTDYIGDPEVNETLVQIPGRSGFYDISEVVSGKPTFSTRKISLKVGGLLNDRQEWDNEISRIRNLIHGRVVQIVFDNDPLWYWQGRCEVVDFDRFRRLGTFKIQIPNALPFKYYVFDSADSWLWDPFDFEDGIIPGYTSIDVEDESLTFSVGALPVNPIIKVNLITRVPFYVSWDTHSERIDHEGTYRFPDMILYDDTVVTFNGAANITVTYRSMSL